MFSPHPSSRFQKIGISSLIFLSGMGSIFAAPTTPLGELDGGKFSQYFQNLASTNCGSAGVMTGFLSTPYLKGNCVSIGPIIGAFFNGLIPNVAPAGTAITGFNTDGTPKFGQASQWVGIVPGNIYYTGGNVGIGTNIIGNSDKLRIETPEGFWGTVFYRNGGIIGGIHTNNAMLTLQNMNGALMYFSGANIGIGTTNPGAKLDVNGQIIGGFGAMNVGGILDWNDPTNARSGNGYSILRGNTVNGPTPSSGVYYHPFSFEYSSKNGGGNLTQFAIPYNVDSLNAGMYLRTRYSNTWTTWSRIISENTNGNVGIGTTSPAAKLTINNTVANQPALSIGDNGLDNAGTYGMVNLTRPADTTRASLAFIRQGNYVWQMGYVPNTNNFGIYPWNLTSNGVPAMTFGSNGNVGIGTINPGTKLDVNGGINVNGRIKTLGSSLFAQSDNTSTSYDKAAIQIREAQYGGNNTFLAPRISFHWGNTVASQIGIESTGRISILNNPGTNYENLIAKSVYSQNWFRSIGDTGWYNETYGGGWYMTDTTWLRAYGGKSIITSGNIQAGGNIYSSNYYYTSDKRLKKDIVPIVSPLEKIKALSGYTFSWKDTGVKSVGLIAQEVEKIFPELVGETQTTSGMTIKTVQYGNLVAPLIESVKELSHLHDQDQKKIEDLKSEVDQMKKDIEFLRSQIKK